MRTNCELSKKRSKSNYTIKKSRKKGGNLNNDKLSKNPSWCAKFTKKMTKKEKENYRKKLLESKLLFRWGLLAYRDDILRLYYAQFRKNNNKKNKNKKKYDIYIFIEEMRKLFADTMVVGLNMEKINSKKIRSLLKKEYGISVTPGNIKPLTSLLDKNRLPLEDYALYYVKPKTTKTTKTTIYPYIYNFGKELLKNKNTQSDKKLELDELVEYNKKDYEGVSKACKTSLVVVERKNKKNEPGETIWIKPSWLVKK